jgi:hypothetical protein
MGQHQNVPRNTDTGELQMTVVVNIPHVGVSLIDSHKKTEGRSSPQLARARTSPRPCLYLSLQYSACVSCACRVRAVCLLCTCRVHSLHTVRACGFGRLSFSKQCCDKL